MVIPIVERGWCAEEMKVIKGIKVVATAVVAVMAVEVMVKIANDMS
mgnify:CR=1 FL=1